MKDKKTSFPMSLEPERYELAESAAYHFDFDRRQFLKVFGGGILILVKLDEALRAQETGGRPLEYRFRRLRRSYSLCGVEVDANLTSHRPRPTSNHSIC